MLSRSGTCLLTRSSTPARRTIATTNPRLNVYVLPVDPKAPSAPAAANVDAAALWRSTPAANRSKPPKAGTTRIFYDTPRGTDSKDVTALASLGDKWATKAGDERREVIRKVIGNAVKAVKALGEDVDGETVLVDASADPHAAGTSSALSFRNDFVNACAPIQPSHLISLCTTLRSRQNRPRPSTLVPPSRYQPSPNCAHLRRTMQRYGKRVSCTRMHRIWRERCETQLMIRDTF